MNNEGNTM